MNKQLSLKDLEAAKKELFKPLTYSREQELMDNINFIRTLLLEDNGEVLSKEERTAYLKRAIAHQKDLEEISERQDIVNSLNKIIEKINQNIKRGN